MPRLTDEKETYGRPLTIGERAQKVTVMAQLPFAIIWMCMKSAVSRPKHLSFRRARVHAMIRWRNENLTLPMMQSMTPQSVDTYTTWAKSRKLPVLVEGLPDDTSIMWIGPKRTDNVILCVHGGAYVTPLKAAALNFYMHLQRELEKGGRKVGIAVLSYALLPTAGFPTQVQQLAIAVQHLFELGVHPSKLYLIGDSSGGHIILTFLSHILHPLPGIRQLKTPLSSPIRGVHLLSPWVCMSGRPQLRQLPNDTLSVMDVNDLADLFLTHASSYSLSADQQMRYLDPFSAPSGWFDRIDGVIERLLLTVGNEEIFRDDVVALSQILRKSMSISSGITTTRADFTFVVHDGGVHGDPILDFITDVNPKKEDLSSLTPTIVKWFEEGIKSVKDDKKRE